MNFAYGAPKKARGFGAAFLGRGGAHEVGSAIFQIPSILQEYCPPTQCATTSKGANGKNVKPVNKTPERVLVLVALAGGVYFL